MRSGEKGDQIVTQAREMKAGFGVKCSKFSGAVSVELLRSALSEEGIPTSSRDVFVRGIPVEVDLVIPRAAQVPALGVLYEPQQVVAALEVKNSGLFGGGSLDKLRHVFGCFRAIGIQCAYVTLEERRNHPWAASSERLGFPCFTLAWHKTTGGPFELTDEWLELVKFLRQCTGLQRASSAGSGT
jgi:hypothetical protein